MPPPRPRSSAVTCVGRRQALYWSEALSFLPAPRSTSLHTPSPSPLTLILCLPLAICCCSFVHCLAPLVSVFWGQGPCLSGSLTSPQLPEQDWAQSRCFCLLNRRVDTASSSWWGSPPSAGVTCVRGKAAHRPSLPGGDWAQGAGRLPPRPVLFFRSLGQAAGFQQWGGGSPDKPVNPGSLLTRTLPARSPEPTQRPPKALVLPWPLSQPSPSTWGRVQRGEREEGPLFKCQAFTERLLCASHSSRLGGAARNKKSFPALRKRMLWWGEQRKIINNYMMYVNQSTR